jgi:hypothetical protein
VVCFSAFAASGLAAGGYLCGNIVRRKLSGTLSRRPFSHLLQLKPTIQAELRKANGNQVKKEFNGIDVVEVKN